MYFYSIRPLKERLASGPLSESESVPYLGVFLVSSGIMASLPGEPGTFWDWVQVVLGAALAVVGTWVLYRANGGSQGRDFLHRYLVLGWVVAVRFFTVVAPAVFVFLLAVDGTGWGSKGTPLLSQGTSLLDVAIGFILELSYLLYFGRHLDDLRRLTEQRAAAEATAVA